MSIAYVGDLQILPVKFPLTSSILRKALCVGSLGIFHWLAVPWMQEPRSWCRWRQSQPRQISGRKLQIPVSSFCHCRFAFAIKVHVVFSLSTRLLTCAWGFVNKDRIGIMIKTKPIPTMCQRVCPDFPLGLEFRS